MIQAAQRKLKQAAKRDQLRKLPIHAERKRLNQDLDVIASLGNKKSSGDNFELAEHLSVTPITLTHPALWTINEFKQT